MSIGKPTYVYRLLRGSGGDDVLKPKPKPDQQNMCHQEDSVCVRV